jgi:hypothetical protein
MIIQDLSFTNNTIQVFAYEGFRYTISNPNPTFTLQTVSNSGALDPTPLYFTKVDNSSYIFGVPDTSNNLTAGTTGDFVLTVSGTSIQTSSNSVVINPGRFLDGCGNSLSNNVYTFYKNETIPRIQLVAPSFTLKTPTSIPFLPPGLSFVRDSSFAFSISGTPTVTVPNSNYQIIGTQQGGSKVITTRFNMVVSNERLRLNLSGTSTINDMRIGTDISSRVITVNPPVGTSAVRYTFPSFPDGIVVRDLLGNLKTSPFTVFSSNDASYSFVLTGRPTSNAAYALIPLANNTCNTTVQVARTIPTPIIESSQDFSFRFGPTVLFDQSTVPQLYTNIAFDPSSIFFRAQTYFAGSNIPITSIFSPNLRSDLSLVFVPAQSRAYLKGNPIQNVSGTATYTIRATDASLNTRDLSATISVVDETISFSSPVGDVCVNYILSRPVDQFKSGYYESNIRFIATANTGRPVTLSAPALAGTGLSLDSSGTIVGFPTTVTPLADLSVNATTGTTSNTKTIKLAVVNDVITLGDVSASKFDFVQNVAITPFQIPVTNVLSGRNVINYTTTNLPSGLSISPAGLISGTCSSAATLSGDVIVTASTGFATGSKSYPFTVEPDTILFTVPQSNYTYSAGGSVYIPVTGVSYSGTAVSNYDLSLVPSYGFSIGSNTGLISGNWTTSVPPQAVLPSSCNFSITAQAGSVAGVLPASFTASPVIQNTSFVFASGSLFRNNGVSWENLSSVINVPNAFDIQLRNRNVDGNFVLFTANDSIYRATNATTINRVIVGDSSSNYQRVSSIAFKPGSTKVWASGIRNFPDIGQVKANLLQSDDNGLTWRHFGVFQDQSTSSLLLSRNSNDVFASNNPYLDPGIALAYKDGVLMAGGSGGGGIFDPIIAPTMFRSTDEGLTWNSVTNGFLKECAYFNFDVSGRWVATGSDSEESIYHIHRTGTTIKYSGDRGQTWSDASGGFTVFGYEIVSDGSGTWMATGIDNIGYLLNGQVGLKYSTDAVNWSNVDLSSTDMYGLFGWASGTGSPAPLPLSPSYDGSNWNVFVQRQDASLNWVSEIYSSATPSGTWVKTDVTSSFAPVSGTSNTRFVGYTRPQYLRTGNTKVIDINLTLNAGIGNGPTITSPSTTSFLLYQYMPMSLTLTATGTGGRIYFFIADDELPPGLNFDPLTNTISGKAASIGNFATRVYTKDNNGVTLTNFSFTVDVPRVIRKQDGAGAYTYLLKQYTEVLGAQNARDSRVLPSQERMLGEFMSPPAPDVITQPFTTTKCAVCKRGECPTVNERVDGGDVRTAVCDFIDANTTSDENAIDAGNAEANVCD